MPDVKGYIDTINHQGVTGWISSGMSASEETRFIRIWVDGEELGTVSANVFRPDLIKAKVSNGKSGFRFLFPIPPNPLVDHKIEIRDRDTGTSVLPCPIILKSLLTATENNSMLEFDRSFKTVNVRNARLAGEVWALEVELIGPSGLRLEAKIENGIVRNIHVASNQDEILDALGLQRQIAQLNVRSQRPGEPIILELMGDPAGASKDASVCTICIPGQMPAYCAALTQESISRVSGPSATRDLYAAGGFNTAYRIWRLIKEHFGQSLSSCKCGLDWGIGAGRVALPLKQMVPQLSLSGSDVDQFNVSFGKSKYPEIEFTQSPFYPPLPFRDATFDFAYGISVVTHLTEGAQAAWLKELRRIVKPGAPVILTVHGEHAILSIGRIQPAILASTSARGISDDTPDRNLGPKLQDKSYYRATYHARKYISRAWAEHFDVLAQYPCANISQDYVVLRAK